jgi:sulfatase maturation enzyme AslB (radical SAM superfamily)
MVQHWRDEQRMLERYDQIVTEKYEPQLMQNPDDLDIAEIEINRNCNIDCVMCNTSMSTRPSFNMELDLFEHAVKYAKSEGRGYTALHTIGEPLMNKNLPDYFAIARKNGVDIRLSSNALILHKHIDFLIENADILTEIRFSIDGASRETYEKIRCGGKWERLIANMEEFREKTQATKPFRQVRISSIVSMDVQHEMGHHLQFWSRYVPMEMIELNLVSGLSPNNSYFLTQSILKKHIMPWPPCYMLFGSALHILNDGRVTACCRDYNGDLVYGNIKDNTPKELLNCDNVLELRRQHLENRIPKNSLCASCFFVNPVVTQSFHLFVNSLVRRFKDNWDVPKMQGRFDEFFAIFADQIPNRRQFATLLRN